MGASELRDWEEYYAVEPWGQERDNIHAGMIVAALINQNRKRGGKSYSHVDFMIRPLQEKHASNRRKFMGAMRAMATKPEG